MNGLLSLDGSLRELDDARADQKSRMLKNAVSQVCQVYLDVPVSRLAENIYDENISRALFAFRLKVDEATPDVLDKLAEDFCVSALRYDSEYAQAAMQLKAQLLEQVGGANSQYIHRPKTVCYTAEQTRHFMRMRTLRHETQALELVNSWRRSVIQQADKTFSGTARHEAGDNVTAQTDDCNQSDSVDKKRVEQIKQLDQRQATVSLTLARIQAKEQSVTLEIEHIEAQQSQKPDSFEKVQLLRRINSQPRLDSLSAIDPPAEPPRQSLQPKQIKSNKFAANAERLNEIAGQLFKFEKCTNLAQINARNRRFALQLFHLVSQNDEISELECWQLAEVIQNPMVKKRLQQLSGEAKKQQNSVEVPQQQQRRRRSVMQRFIKREEFINAFNDKTM